MTRETSPLQVLEDFETGNRFVVYTTRDGTQLDLLFDGEEPWFTQADLAAMYGVTVPTIITHIQKFTEDGELDGSTTRDFLVVRQEGNREVRRPIAHYGLDVAFYVGYRVNSTEGKLFRRWATQMLVQLATQGFVVNKRALKGSPTRLAKLREIIRELRAEEANVYAELRHMLAMCKDYDPRGESTRLFFAHFQNRLHYAITGFTAAELLRKTADASKPNMGLQAWNDDQEYPLQSDAINAKNYLGDIQLEDLHRLASMVLDFFEDQTKRGWLVSMEDAEKRLEEILTVNKRKLLKGFGTVSADDAEKHAKEQYKIHDKVRRAEWKAAALTQLKASAAAIPRPTKASVIKRTTLAAMREWFYKHHSAAVERSPFVDGEYVYPLVEPSEALEAAFPDASEKLISKLADELDQEGPWLSNAFLEILDLEGMDDEP